MITSGVSLYPSSIIISSATIAYSNKLCSGIWSLHPKMNFNDRIFHLTQVICVWFWHYCLKLHVAPARACHCTFTISSRRVSWVCFNYMLIYVLLDSKIIFQSYHLMIDGITAICRYSNTCFHRRVTNRCAKFCEEYGMKKSLPLMIFWKFILISWLIR